jgi:hypothetical protein
MQDSKTKAWQSKVFSSAIQDVDKLWPDHILEVHTEDRDKPLRVWERGILEARESIDLVREIMKVVPSTEGCYRSDRKDRLRSIVSSPLPVTTWIVSRL